MRMQGPKYLGHFPNTFPDTSAGSSIRSRASRTYLDAHMGRQQQSPVALTLPCHSAGLFGLSFLSFLVSTTDFSQTSVTIQTVSKQRVSPFRPWPKRKRWLRAKSKSHSFPCCRHPTHNTAGSHAKPDPADTLSSQCWKLLITAIR